MDETCVLIKCYQLLYAYCKNYSAIDLYYQTFLCLIFAAQTNIKLNKAVLIVFWLRKAWAIHQITNCLRVVTGNYFNSKNKILHHRKGVTFVGNPLAKLLISNIQDFLYVLSLHSRN
jgi:hypothetical protein